MSACCDICRDDLLFEIELDALGLLLKTRRQMVIRDADLSSGGMIP